MKNTENNIKRLERDFSGIAREKVTADITSGTIYIFGSELATLRILRKYLKCYDRAAQGYSINLKTFYFRLEAHS